MTTSNSSEPVGAETAGAAASGPETSAQPISQAQDISATSAPEVSGLESLKEKAKKLSKSEPAATTEALAANASQEPPKPVFQPNWKYKAFGKEKEIEEMWRPLIKDADSEKKVKDIFTRADAFDDLKARFDGTSREHQELMSEYNALDRDVKKVMTFRNNGDLDNFFKALRIPKQDVFAWVKKELDLSEQSPEAARLAEMQANERQKLYEMSQENEMLQQRYQTQAVQARTMQLDMVLSRSDVSSVASRYDETQGRIGAFRDLVIEEARNHYYATGGDNGGRDLSAEEATQMVMQKFGKLLEQRPQAAQGAIQAGAPQPQAQAKPVIPVVNGRGTSPVKKMPKSLDDLRALYKEMQSQSV